MSITLSVDEQELLHEEIAAFARSVADAEARRQYELLAAAVDGGELPDEALAPIGALLEVGLLTGRIRKLHRAADEQKLLRLYAKTPPGAARSAAVAEVNRALQQLEGQEIETVRVHARLPGEYLLMISTNACEIALRFLPDGVGVESVAVGV